MKDNDIDVTPIFQHFVLIPKGLEMQEKDRDAVEEKQQEAASTLKGLRPLTWAGLFGPRFCGLGFFLFAFLDVVRLLYEKLLERTDLI